MAERCGWSIRYGGCLRGLVALSVAVLSVRVKRMRAAGRYSRQMVEAAFATWQINPNASTLLQWATTRRDMGLPLSRRIAMDLLRVMPKMRLSQRVRAVALVAEAYPALLGELPVSWLQAVDKVLPALGFCWRTDDLNRELASVATQQALWRQDFAETVRGAAARDGLAMLGNAAYLRESCIGGSVDECHLVVRFNHYGRGQDLSGCVGTKTDVWVVSPAYKGPPPVGVPKWVVVAGPAMEYRLQNWQPVRSLLKGGSKVLTVPLTVWHSCVQQLQAPPSSGLLMLCWIQEILGGSFTGVRVAGVGLHSAGRPYTALNPQKGSTSRHDWLAEAAWVQRQSLAGFVE